MDPQTAHQAQAVHLNRGPRRTDTPIPPRPHDLCQALGIVLVSLVHLHLERGARVPRLKAEDVEPSPSQLAHKPGRHRAGLDANPGVL